jgi:uncharacterized membrane protein
VLIPLLLGYLYILLGSYFLLFFYFSHHQSSTWDRKTDAAQRLSLFTAVGTVQEFFLGLRLIGALLVWVAG